MFHPRHSRQCPRGGVYLGKTINFLEFHPAYEKGDTISFWQWFSTGDDSVLQGHLVMSGDIWLSKHGRGWGSGDSWHPAGKDQGVLLSRARPTTKNDRPLLPMLRNLAFYLLCRTVRKSLWNKLCGCEM